MEQRKTFCKNCAYWNRTTDNSGECRNKPPLCIALPAQVVQRVQGLNAAQQPQIVIQPYFPPTEQNQWCGEYAPDTILR
jgi:hypothetical protein